MSSDSLIIDELVDSEIDGMLEDDSYYRLYETPLKSAKQIKAEHRAHLKELFSFNNLRSELDKASALILALMPNFVPPHEFYKIKAEMQGAPAHFTQFIQKMKSSDKTILLQEVFGFSNDTLIHVYSLALDLVNKGHIEDALAIFTFLGTMAPHVLSYWIAQGVCFQALNRHEEAVAAFTAAKLINSSDPHPLKHLIECHLSLKDHENAKKEMEELKRLVKALPVEEKAKWEHTLQHLGV